MLNIILIVAGVFLFFWAFLVYNRLVGLRVRAASAWSDIDVQLKRRCDLVPNLVQVVKSYALHEKATLEAVMAARAQALSAQGNKDVARGQAFLAGSLKSLLVVVEGYPLLKADGTFLELHKQLVEIEDTLQYARRYYNGVVRDFNTAIAVFPNNLLSGLAGFKEKEFFGLDEENP